LGVGSFGDYVAGDEAGSVGLVELIKGVDRGFVLAFGHDFGSFCV
jgi:hypothetical protein